LITLTLCLIGAIATYFLNSYALILYFLAYFMNIIYEKLKEVPFLGNIWFGFMIALAPLYGALASTNLSLLNILHYSNLIYLAILVAASASALCYYTYFKDYEGDKKVGKKTIIVALGPQRAKYLNFPISILPFLLTWTFIRFGFLDFKVNYIFLSLVFIALSFCLYSAFFSFKNLDQDKKILELNFECTPLFLCSLIALLDPIMGLLLFIFSFAGIKIFYWLMYRKDFY
jgi:geranylgeranylglycerol-phosphate geranylgeranyltransferase